MDKQATIDENSSKLSNIENDENQEIISMSLKSTLEEDSIKELKHDSSKPEVSGNAIDDYYKASTQTSEKINITCNGETDCKDEGNHKLCEIDVRC